MKKMILAGASTFALLAVAGAASAQTVNVDLTPALLQIQADTDGLGGFYINSAINNNTVSGAVRIDTDPLLTGLNASDVDASLQVSAAAAAAAATTGATISLPGGVPTADIGPVALGLGLSGAGQLNLDIDGTVISSTDVIKTTAIGAVNTGVTSLAAVSKSQYSDFSTDFTDGGSLSFSSSAANSGSNTSNTSADAAAAATALLVDGAISDSRNNISGSTSAGPAAVVAANFAVNNALVDGSVTLTGATAVNIEGTATTAIGAVNTGTITNGLPGSITIVAGDTSSTSTTNNNTTTAGGSGSNGNVGNTP